MHKYCWCNHKYCWCKKSKMETVNTNSQSQIFVFDSLLADSKSNMNGVSREIQTPNQCILDLVWNGKRYVRNRFRCILIIFIWFNMRGKKHQIRKTYKYPSNILLRITLFSCFFLNSLYIYFLK